MANDFFLTNLELRESTDTGEVKEGLSHRSMEGMFLLRVLELAARGEPRGAVTFVHDAGDHGGRYRALAERLAEENWAVALPDMRGHGDSEGDRGHSGGVAEAVRDIGEIQDHLAYRMPDAPKVVIGLGLGALYSLAFALERPGVVSALVLAAPLHEPRFGPPEAPTGLKKFFKKVGPRTPCRIGWPADAQSDTADPLVHDWISVRAAEQALVAAEMLTRVGDTGVPVLVLHGSDDPVTAVQKSQALAGKGVAVKVIPGARHDLFHGETAGLAVDAVAEFLAQ